MPADLRSQIRDVAVRFKSTLPPVEVPTETAPAARPARSPIGRRHGWLVGVAAAAALLIFGALLVLMSSGDRDVSPAEGDLSPTGCPPVCAGGEDAPTAGGFSDPWQVWGMPIGGSSSVHLTVAAGGTVWAIGEADGQLMRLQGDQWTAEGRPPGFGHVFWDLVATADDVLYGFTERSLGDGEGLIGVLRYRNGSWSQVASLPLTDPARSEVSVDADGDLWFVNGGTLVRMSDGYRIDVLSSGSVPEGLVGVVAGDGTVWIYGGTADAGSFIYQLDGTEWTSLEMTGFGERDEGAPASILSMASGPDRRPWVVHSAGVSHWTGGSWVNYQTPAASYVALADDGTVWAADPGLWRFDGDRFVAVDSPGDALTSLTVAGDGSVWVTAALLDESSGDIAEAPLVARYPPES